MAGGVLLLLVVLNTGVVTIGVAVSRGERRFGLGFTKQNIILS